MQCVLNQRQYALSIYMASVICVADADRICVDKTKCFASTGNCCRIIQQILPLPLDYILSGLIDGLMHSSACHANIIEHDDLMKLFDNIKRHFQEAHI